MPSSFSPLPTVSPGDRVAVLSPSFGAPARWPHVYKLGLKRLRDVFGLQAVEFPTTRAAAAPAAERARDLIAAFTDPDLKAVIASLGGDDQVTYVSGLPREPFARNPKPFFGFSDNTHLANHLWQCGVSSFYGGHIFSQFAMHGAMDELTLEYLRGALFDRSEREIRASGSFNDVGLNWDDPSLLASSREYEPNEGWFWDGAAETAGISWGGCLESIDEMLRHDVPLPTPTAFTQIVLIIETSEEIPSAPFVHRALNALGERGILQSVRAVLVGRPKAWEFDKPRSAVGRRAYRAEQRDIVLTTIREYNGTAPVVQNLDLGHTDPQICMPYGSRIRVDPAASKIWARF